MRVVSNKNSGAMEGFRVSRITETTLIKLNHPNGVTCSLPDPTSILFKPTVRS